MVDIGGLVGDDDEDDDPYDQHEHEDERDHQARGSGSGLSFEHRGEAFECLRSDGRVGECDEYALWVIAGGQRREALVSLMGLEECGRTKRHRSRHERRLAGEQQQQQQLVIQNDGLCASPPGETGAASGAAARALCLQEEGQGQGREDGSGWEASVPLVVRPYADGARGWGMEGGRLSRGDRCAQVVLTPPTAPTAGQQLLGLTPGRGEVGLVAQPCVAGFASVRRYDMGPFVLVTTGTGIGASEGLCFHGTGFRPCDMHDPDLRWGIELMSLENGGQFSLFKAYRSASASAVDSKGKGKGKRQCLTAKPSKSANRSGSKEGEDDGGKGGEGESESESFTSGTSGLSLGDCSKRGARVWSLSGERLSMVTDGGGGGGGGGEELCVAMRSAGGSDGKDDDDQEVEALLQPCHTGFEGLLVQF